MRHQIPGHILPVQDCHCKDWHWTSLLPFDQNLYHSTDLPLVMRFDRKLYCLYILFAFVGLSGYAQEDATPEEQVLEEQIIEQLVEDMEFDLDIGEITERLRYHMRHPLDLNSATEEQLTALVFLTPMQVSNLLRHRESTGPFISILELQAIEGFTLSTVELLRRFVKVSAPSIWKDFQFRHLAKNSEHDLMIRYGRVVQLQRGYRINDENRSRYLGSPDRVAVRFRYNYENRISLSVNMDKDAGEPFFHGAQSKGFDFYSASILIRDIGRAKSIVVGDYALQFGQGLVLWNGLNFGKGAWIGSVARQGAGLRQYKSLTENNFMRGVATHLQFGRWHVTPFAAWNKLTGNVIEADGRREITSINYSGYHRTPSEQRNRRAIDQFAYGMDATYQYKRLKVGATALMTHFDGHVLPADLLRNAYAFRGNRLANVGLHYQYTYRNFYFYGETAISMSPREFPIPTNTHGHAFASNNGFFASLSPKLTAVVNYRNYGKAYHHFFAQSMGEQSSVGNEKGIYGGLVYHPSRRIEWLTYLDLFSFPWLRYRADAPTQGMDFLSQLAYIWYKRGRLTIRFRERMRQENMKLPDRNENLLADVIRRQARLDFQYKLNRTWSVRSRIELAFYEKELDTDELGYTTFQDVLWTSRNGRVTTNARLAYFETKSYNSRIYAYERDVLYGAGFPVYYGRGLRYYVNCRVRVRKSTDLWLRYAETWYPDQESIGSSLDLIEGNRRSDFRIQLRYRW